MPRGTGISDDIGPGPAECYHASELRFILSVGGCFAWLLSYPVFGPTLAAMATARGLPAGMLVLAFLGAHACGLVAAGTLTWLRPAEGLPRAVALAVCGLLGLSTLVAPDRACPGLMFLLGMVSAPPVIAWMARFRRLVAPARRARVVALIITVANLPLYGLTLAGMGMNWQAMLLGATAFLLLPIACSIGEVRRAEKCRAQAPAGFPTPASPPPPVAAPHAAPPPRGEAPPPRPASAPAIPWLVVPLILAIYLIGGTAYDLVYPGRHSNPVTIHLGVLPYIVTALVLARMARVRGHLAPFALSTLGTAIALYPLAGHLWSDALIHVVMQAGFAGADLFLWTYLADAAPAGKEGEYYGWGLGLNAIALFAGFLALERWLSVAPLPRVAVATAGVIPLLLVAPLASRLQPPQPAPAAPDRSRGPAASSARAEATLEGFGLTRRERAVACLVLEGRSNDEISKRLSVSPNTLKTHLKHIYAKTGTSNRKDLILLVARSSQSLPPPGAAGHDVLSPPNVGLFRGGGDGKPIVGDSPENRLLPPVAPPSGMKDSHSHTARRQ